MAVTKYNNLSSDGIRHTLMFTDKPSDPVEGSCYLNRETRKTYIFSRGSWVELALSKEVRPETLGEYECVYCGTLRQSKFKKCPSCAASKARDLSLPKNSESIKNLGAYSCMIGDEKNTSFRVNHGLGSNAIVSCQDSISGELVINGTTLITTHAQIDFARPPSRNEFKVLVMG